MGFLAALINEDMQDLRERRKKKTPPLGSPMFQVGHRTCWTRQGWEKTRAVTIELNLTPSGLAFAAGCKDTDVLFVAAEVHFGEVANTHADYFFGNLTD